MPDPALEIERARAARSTVVYERRHHRGLLPKRAFYKPTNQPTVRLRGVPSILPMDHAGINTQRVGSAGLVLGVVSGLAPAAAIPLLIGAFGFQVGFGVRQGFRMALNARQQKKALKAENEQLVRIKGPPPYTTSPIVSAVARMNKENTLRANTSYFPAGGLSSVVNLMVASATLTKPALIGGLSAGAAAASLTLTHIATPLLSLFSTTSAVYGLYYISFSYKRQKHIGDILNVPVTGDEKQVHKLALKRLHTERQQAAFSTACNFGIAIGAPLLLFVGPYALIPLVPAAVGSVISSYTWARKVAYVPQFTQEERLQFRSKHAIVNEVARSNRNYDVLKSMKSKLRYYYPFAAQSPVRHFVALKNKLHRRVHKREESQLPPAEFTVRQFWNEHLDVEQGFQRSRVKIALHKMQQSQANEHPEGVTRQQEHISDATRAMAALQREQESMPPLTHGAAVQRFTWLVNLLLDQGAFPAFAQGMISDKKLRARWPQAFGHPGKKQWVVNAKALQDSFTRQPETTQGFILAHAAVHARTALLTFKKLSYQFRQRETIDLLTLHVRASAQARDAKAKAAKDAANAGQRTAPKVASNAEPPKLLQVVAA